MVDMKALALFSGGIDSPVAAKLMIERGLAVHLAFFDNRPYAPEGSKEAALRAMERLRALGAVGGWLIPNGENQQRIVESCDRKSTCLFCKRNMVRSAEGLAERLGADALITGEALGSKASQTSRNLMAISDATHLSILRPLLCFDKEEIISMSRGFGIFESTNSSELCCSAVPDAPSTSSSISFLREEERKLGEVGKTVQETLKKAQRIF